MKNKIKNAETTRKSFSGPKTGRFQEMEEEVVNFVRTQWQSGRVVSIKTILFKADETARRLGIPHQEFKGSRGWCTRMMRRNGISLRRWKFVCQKVSTGVKAAFVTKMKAEIEEKSSSLGEDYGGSFPAQSLVKDEETSAFEHDECQDRLSISSSSNVSANQKKNHLATVEKYVTDKRMEIARINGLSEDVLPLVTSIKEEPYTEEENYNADASYPEEIMFVTCDTEHEKAVKCEEL